MTAHRCTPAQPPSTLHTDDPPIIPVARPPPKLTVPPPNNRRQNHQGDQASPQKKRRPPTLQTPRNHLPTTDNGKRNPTKHLPSPSGHQPRRPQNGLRPTRRK